MNHDKLNYRSFCYDDWLCEFIVNPSPFEPKYLDMLVDEVAGGGADVLVMNPNGQTVSHPSKVWQTMWKAYQAGDLQSARGYAAFGQPKECEAFVKELVRMAEQKFDYLAYIYAACRRRGIATGASLRMNDCHGNVKERSLLVSDFHVDHPQFHLPGPTGVCLNYLYPEVREHYMKLIMEMIHDYDIDVLDLDFCRQPWCFPEDGQVEEHGEVMTAFIRDVHREIRSTGHSIALLPRIPSSTTLSRNAGFDVARWAREGLIDGVILGEYIHAAWRASVPEWRKLVGDRIPIYTSGDYFADSRENLPIRELGLHPDLMRGFAAGQLANGADGIYWFNFVVVREALMKGFWDKPSHRDAARPGFEAIGECNTLESLRGKSKTYIATSITQHGPAPIDSPRQLPIDLKAGEEHAFELLMAREPSPVQVHVALTFYADVHTEDIHVTHINDRPLTVQPVHRTGPEGAQSLVFGVQPFMMDGLNRMVIRNGATPVRLVGFEVHIQGEVSP